MRLGLLLVLALSACGGEQTPAGDGNLARALGGTPDDGFERALQPRAFEFPRDHGAHPDYQTEWWYFTGHLASGARRFGYQLTFFRQALVPPPGAAAPRPGWASHEVMMAHFALTDIDGAQFHAAQRLTRSRPELAWSSQTALAVAVEDWSALADGAQVRLTAQHQGVAIDLAVTLTSPLLRHGNQGLSRKGPDAGDASYYYSMPRLPTQGTVRLPSGQYLVSGSSWLDREWSTSVLGADQVGWDWFSLNLDHDTDLMLFQLRDAAGQPDRFSAGTLRRGAQITTLTAADFTLTPIDAWRSSRSGVRYPAAWQLDVPGQALQLTVRPLLADQELNLAFRYWEGAVSADGRLGSQPLSGTGYLEMTGY